MNPGAMALTVVPSGVSSLYRASPADFTATRDARATDARQAGDRDLAAAIRKLRRPTTSAWLVNTLVRERAEQLSELLDLGAALRDAQTRLAGDDLRRLSRERQDAVRELAGEAREIARGAGQPVSESVERELEGTLQAAVADPAAGDAVRSGRLTTALHYSGFGPVNVTGAVATPARKPAASMPRRRTAVDRDAPARQRREDQRTAAEQRWEDARGAATEAGRESDAQERRVAAAKQQEDGVRQQITDLEVQLERLRAEQTSTGRELREARRARDVAARAMRLADERAARAKDALDRIED